MTGTELPGEINQNKELCELLEKIRATACCKMGFAKDLQDAADNSPAVPKVGFVAEPKNYVDIARNTVEAKDMDICARVISVFQCHKACLVRARDIGMSADIGQRYQRGGCAEGFCGTADEAFHGTGEPCADWPSQRYYDYGAGGKRGGRSSYSARCRRSENSEKNYGRNSLH